MMVITILEMDAVARAPSKMATLASAALLTLLITALLCVETISKQGMSSVTTITPW
jgi:hypothetical protein